MQKNSNKLQLPDGFKDYLPEEAERKRLLEEKWARLFKSWSYREIVSPSFEYYDTLMMNVGVESLSLLKTIDRSGHILALRPDMTSPIARLVATRMKEQPLPQRLFYSANVFRYENEIQRGRYREFYQAGVELIGPKGPRADGEIIALAVEALETAGVENFQIGLGHMEITKALLETLCADCGSEKEADIKEALSRKNFVKLAQLISSKENAQVEKIYKLIMTQANLDEMIHRLKELNLHSRWHKAIADLESLTQLLNAYGVKQRIFVDFSILRDFDYYTGIVFEGYSENLGYPICGGGRYDQLLGSFGYDRPATGFAIGVERVLSVIDPEKLGKASTTDYLICGTEEGHVYTEANALRKQGFIVEIDLMQRTEEEAAQYAEQKGIKKIIRL